MVHGTHSQERVVHSLVCGGRMGLHRALSERWNVGDGGREAHCWLGLMEKRRLNFKKANIQAYTNLAGEAKEEMIHGRGEPRGDDPLRLLFREG